MMTSYKKATAAATIPAAATDPTFSAPLVGAEAAAAEVADGAAAEVAEAPGVGGLVAGFGLPLTVGGTTPLDGRLTFPTMIPDFGSKRRN